MPPLRECREDIAADRATPSWSGSRASGDAPARLAAAALAGAAALRLPRQHARAGEHPRARARALRRASEISRGATCSSARRREAAAEPPRRRRHARPPLPDTSTVERKAILEALGKTGFNRTAAAKLLGITFRQLRYRMQRLGIKDDRSRR